MRQKGATWEVISFDLNIRKKDGRIDSGLAYRIIHDGYIPKRIETQIRLGLDPICPTCNKSIHRKRNPKRKSLLDYPDKELRYLFENRIPME